MQYDEAGSLALMKGSGGGNKENGYLPFCLFPFALLYVKERLCVWTCLHATLAAGVVIYVSERRREKKWGGGEDNYYLYRKSYRIRIHNVPGPCTK